MISKICKACNIEKDIINNFRPWITRSGETRYINYCSPCKDKRSRIQKKPETLARAYKKQQAKRTFNRKNLINVENFILEDTRRFDKRKGLVNNLTKNFIRETIASGCQYCGATNMRITLDRIDNDKGHTMENCIPACMRCNNIRSNMPYDAWLELVPGVRIANRKGIFGKWIGGIKQFLD